MLALILFAILIYQRMNMEKILLRFPNKDLTKAKRRANFGLVFLGVLAVLEISLNLHLHRSLWDSDFISPFFN
jgi:hypothetical protein